MFQHHPPHIRKKIALGITACIAVILVALMIIIYTTKRASGDKGSGSALSNFYTTILTKGEAYFGGK